jgi:hypothetical protein
MSATAEKIDVIGAIELAAIDAATAAKRHGDLGQKVAAGVTALQALELHKASGAVAELIASVDILTDAITFRIDDPRHAMLDRVVNALAAMRLAANG